MERTTESLHWRETLVGRELRRPRTPRTGLGRWTHDCHHVLSPAQRIRRGDALRERHIQVNAQCGNVHRMTGIGRPSPYGGLAGPGYRTGLARSSPWVLEVDFAAG